MRASRLLSILMLLQTRGRMTAEALAEQFEVSIRTIYRDIDQLSAAEVPVYAVRGRDAVSCRPARSGRRARPGRHFDDRSTQTDRRSAGGRARHGQARLG